MVIKRQRALVPRERTVTRRPMVLAIPAWGAHVREFLEYSLPTLLAPGNLFAVASDRQVKVVMATREEDYKLFAGEAFDALRDLTDVEFHFLRLTRTPLLHMTETHVKGLSRARDLRGFFVYSNADAIWSNGTLQTIAHRLEKHRAVVTWVCRLQSETLLPELQRLRSGARIVLPPDQFSQLILDHAHEELRNYEVSAQYVPSYPILLMWRSPENDCAVARGHTLGVIGISLDAISDEEFRTYLRNLEGKTIDDTSTYSPILKDCSDVFFAQSTDDIAVASFADRTRFETGTPSIQQKVGRKGHTEALVSTCVSYQRRKEIDKYARYFLTMPYSIGHGADINFHDRCIAETQNIMIRISTICHAREAERDTPDRTRRFAYLMYQIVFKPPAYLLGIVMGTKIWALIARRIKKRLPRLYREANRIAGNVIALKYRTKQS